MTDTLFFVGQYLWCRYKDSNSSRLPRVNGSKSIYEILISIHSGPQLVRSNLQEEYSTMSFTKGKSVLCVGINPAKRDTEETRTAGPSKEILAMIEKQIEEAKAAGYELQMKFIAPDEMEVEIPRVSEILREKIWDGFIIGGGIRKEFTLTIYFERLVNASREIQPETRIGFNTSPNDISSTMKRMFEH